jgi:flagellin-like protein
MKSDRTPLSERGVSPVVGVAILIGIAIILATVIGAFVLPASDQPTDKPSARFDVSQDRVDIDGRFDGSVNNRTTYENVIQVSVEHAGGDGVPQRALHLRLRAETDSSTSTGYLLDYETAENGVGFPFVNLTESRWNAYGDETIGVGDSSDYTLFATDSLGADDDARVEGADIEQLWRGANCGVSDFHDTRNSEGSINITGNPKISARISKDCPFGNTNATIRGGDISEGGRIAPGDSVSVDWSPRGESTSQRLETFEVADPDE